MTSWVSTLATSNMPDISLYPHQIEAIDSLGSGSILMGGVGSGKSRTSLAYFFLKECGGTLCYEVNEKALPYPKDLYIITTARKRDTQEWEDECIPFSLSTNREESLCNIQVTVDSWNNVKKYIDVKNAFFIFDEQRVVGSGVWVKSFLKIAKTNRWILLTATPGDCWLDYVPVFIANGFYKNRSEFLMDHAVWNRYSKYPKIDRYLDQSRLQRYKKQITV